MKFKAKLAFILTAILLLSCFLMGCTPDGEEQGETQTLPALGTGTDTGPGETGGAQPQQTDPGTPQTEPGGQADSGQTGGPVSTTEDEGLEVVSEYTVEIGDNLGVGGN